MSTAPEKGGVAGATGGLPNVSGTADSSDPGSLDTDYRRRLAEAFTDDITWLTIGKGLLEEMIPTLNGQAKNLGVFIGWFWTIYSATTLVAGSILTASKDGLNWLLIAPIFTTLIAYLFAVAAQSPVLDSVDLRSVEEIRSAVHRSARRKIRWIRGCIFFLVITALLIGAGAVVQLV